jgi:hypothetical protein
MDCFDIRFSGDALRRMFERDIDEQTVMTVVRFGETITDYANDQPYPTRLLLGFVEGWPVHVVVAKDAVSKTCFVVTAYRPDPAVWSADYKTRRRP